ncbi:hypothetical protein SAPIO_CDS1236 [Scedosporium apiospermum]|uniref:NmrA-like domain-containing protein n=1 Tax=Pseudallescheria apiosperma TaxID=563466 RepID=A0A084GEV9_PSEDA|nr:uncharacterized protein SAPIO_CDS1236 [Scedosporium apiospermum]KEZ45871.1 hypothetical protein SAPIO_CDS1236 [Scedosporium apiospermum]
MSKLFVVFGATGQQGGSLINYLIHHPEFSKTFRVRGITRDPSKQAAKDLSEKGVEIVRADLSDPKTLAPALEGAYAVFAVTNYWDTGSHEAEEAQGKAVADAALAAGVSLIIWSSLPNITRVTGGRVTNFVHFDSKSRVEDYIRTLGFPSSVFYLPGWYMQNSKHPLFPPPTTNPDGTVVLPYAWPDELEMPYIDVTDTGKYLAPAIGDPAKYNGKQLIGATAFYSSKEVADTWSRITGKKVRHATPEELPVSSGSFMEDNVIRPNPFLTDTGYYGPTGRAELEWLHSQLDPADKLTTWEEYVKANGPWFSA